MKTRLHLQNDAVMIEWADTPTGLLQAKAFRKKASPAFKYCRIRSVIQVHPERIKCGVLYLRSFRKNVFIKG